MEKNSPVRLEKVEETDVKSFLTQENAIIVANWVLIVFLMKEFHFNNFS